jgi:hypothetical protein
LPSTWRRWNSAGNLQAFLLFPLCEWHFHNLASWTKSWMTSLTTSLTSIVVSNSPWRLGQMATFPSSNITYAQDKWLLADTLCMGIPTAPTYIWMQSHTTTQPISILCCLPWYTKLEPSVTRKSPRTTRIPPLHI